MNLSKNGKKIDMSIAIVCMVNHTALRKLSGGPTSPQALFNTSLSTNSSIHTSSGCVDYTKTSSSSHELVRISFNIMMSYIFGELNRKCILIKRMDLLPGRRTFRASFFLPTSTDTFWLKYFFYFYNFVYFLLRIRFFSNHANRTTFKIHWK